MLAVILKKVNCLLLPLLLLTQASTQDDFDWSYHNTNWSEKFTHCNGNRQSPIALEISSSSMKAVPPIKFRDYNLALSRKDVKVSNEGRSIKMVIPVTRNRRRPSISGGLMSPPFEAHSLHFHWGSKAVRGSEHTINGIRYDVEMHIVHKNTNYATFKKAREHPDGISVLAIMMKSVPDYNQSKPFATGLNAIFQLLPQLRTFHSKATINRPVTLDSFLGNINTNKFFTYKGSLTTPPCSETVLWHVFQEPIPIFLKEIEKFWNILDESNKPLINTFRPLQKTEKRQILYRGRRI